MNRFRAKKAMSRNVLAGILITFIVLVCMVSPSFSQPAMMTEKTEINEQQPDSLKVYPEKLRSEEQWETIVNFPGRLIFSPFQLTFWGIEEIVEEIDETMIVPRIILPSRWWTLILSQNSSLHQRITI